MIYRCHKRNKKVKSLNPHEAQSKGKNIVTDKSSNNNNSNDLHDYILTTLQPRYRNLRKYSTMHIIWSNTMIYHRFGTVNLHILFEGSVKLNVKMPFPFFPTLAPYIVVLNLRSSTVGWAHQFAHGLSMGCVTIRQLYQFIAWIDNQSWHFFYNMRSFLHFSYFGFIDLDGFFDLRRIDEETDLTIYIRTI